MKNRLLDIIIWINILLVVADVVGLGTLLYGTTIKNSAYSDIGAIIVMNVAIIYLVTALPYYLISKFMND